MQTVLKSKKKKKKKKEKKEKKKSSNWMNGGAEVKVKDIY